MKSLFCVLFLFSICGYAQLKKEGVVLDEADKSPLEFVGIYNEQDHTMTNADGRFLFSSRSDAITIYRPGYDKRSTTFEKLGDTIYLFKSVLELNEVTVTNEKTVWQKVKDSLDANYALYPFKENFLVRGILRYNGEITRIQDMQGKLQRRTLLYTKEIELGTKDYSVELTNMRKVGLLHDENDVYFKFFTFHELFLNLTPMNATGDDFELTESTFDNGSKTKLNFQTLPHIKTENTFGEYIVNNTNHAIERFHLYSDTKDAPFKESGTSRYRTISSEREVTLAKLPRSKKYFIASSKFTSRIEQTDEAKSYTSFYDVSYIMTTSENEGDFKVKKNVSSTKDIFKIKFPYNSEYWNSQNQLLLTDEMLDFIKIVKDPENDFKVRSNIKY